MLLLFLFFTRVLGNPTQVLEVAWQALHPLDHLHNPCLLFILPAQFSM